MKVGRFTPISGDLFTWHYECDDDVCLQHEQLLSGSMKQWVPCTGINLLISLTETDIYWLNNCRFLHMYVRHTGTRVYSVSNRPGGLYPRTIKT